MVVSSALTPTVSTGIMVANIARVKRIASNFFMMFFLLFIYFLFLIKEIQWEYRANLGSGGRKAIGVP
jgi:hypothetical protein